MSEKSPEHLMLEHWYDNYPYLIELVRGQTPAGKIAHKAMVEMTMLRLNPNFYVSPLIEATTCATNTSGRIEKWERLEKYCIDAQQALRALVHSISLVVMKTRFTGRSKPAKRAMAKLAARRGR